MKVFISWSGDHSRKVAELLKSWLEDVFQGVEAWMSKEDISKGDIWFTNLSDELAKTDFGILSLTAENVTSPWVLFEAGALSKGLSRNRVCPLLINFDSLRLTKPLSEFNAAIPTKDDMLKLAKSINSHGDKPLLTPEKLAKTFEQWWGGFESQFAEIQRQHCEQPALPKPTSEEMIAEILETVRAIQKGTQKIWRPSWRDGLRLSDLVAPEPTIADQGARAFSLHPNDDGGFDVYRSEKPAVNLYLQAIEELRKTCESAGGLEGIQAPEPPPKLRSDARQHDRRDLSRVPFSGIRRQSG